MKLKTGKDKQKLKLKNSEKINKTDKPSVRLIKK